MNIEKLDRTVKPSNQKGFLSLIVGAVLAIFVTLGLVLLMNFLIDAKLEEPDDKEQLVILDPIQKEVEIEDNLKERKVDEIDEPDEPPPSIQKQSIEVDADMGVDVSTGKIAADVDIDIGNSFSDGDIIPLVAIQPDYPRRAAERGTEGYCVVTFVIQTDGTTRDVKVVESTAKVFERSSIKAASRLKYKPKIVDGTPVEVDHFYKFTYELAK